MGGPNTYIFTTYLDDFGRLGTWLFLPGGELANYDILCESLQADLATSWDEVTKDPKSVGFQERNIYPIYSDSRKEWKLSRKQMDQK